MNNFEEYIEWLERQSGRALTWKERKILEERLKSLHPHRRVDAGPNSEEAAKLNLIREELWATINMAASAGVKEYEPAHAGRGRSVVFYMAAAAVIGILVGAYLLFPQRRPGHPGLATTTPLHGPDIAPGHAGAILTLADGSQVVLDSAANGNVAVQGNSRAIKHNGLLSYALLKPGAPVEAVYNIMTTPRGRQYRLMLPDGSTVWLNAASSLKFPTAFTGGSRTVELSGEGYFDIVRNPKQPFIVKVRDKGIDVQVLGTSFDIKAYYDEAHTKTTLLSGAVNVRKASGIKRLAPGQQAVVGNDPGAISVVQTDTAAAIAWVKGQLSIEASDIQALMREISRWYDVDLRFEGKMPSGNLWGILNRNANLSDVLAALESYGVHAELDGKTIVITAKK